MPRKPCYWTRKLELDLVAFVRQRDYIWRPAGNTNHQIQQKYKAYAEFAARLGRGFTARSVRDRWVNIRSTFNHNHRRVERSKLKANSPADIYVPCWPLWKPLQFLKDVCKKEEYELPSRILSGGGAEVKYSVSLVVRSETRERGVSVIGAPRHRVIDVTPNSFSALLYVSNNEDDWLANVWNAQSDPHSDAKRSRSVMATVQTFGYRIFNFGPVPDDFKDLATSLNVKEEQQSELENDFELNIRQRSRRTDRPRRKTKTLQKSNKKSKCKQVIDDLLLAMNPLVAEPMSDQNYWFFGKHVTERLNSMRRIDSDSACHDIMSLLNEWQQCDPA